MILNMRKRIFYKGFSEEIGHAFKTVITAPLRGRAVMTFLESRWGDSGAVQSTATRNEVFVEEDDQNIRQHSEFQQIGAKSRRSLR
jgi:hypothetical protein